MAGKEDGSAQEESEVDLAKHKSWKEVPSSSL